MLVSAVEVIVEEVVTVVVVVEVIPVVLTVVVEAAIVLKLYLLTSFFAPRFETITANSKIKTNSR